MSRDCFLKLAMFKVDNKEKGKIVSWSGDNMCKGPEVGESLSLLRM